MFQCLSGSVFRLGSNPYLDFTRMAEKYGNVFSLQLGSRLVVVLNGAEALREGLVKKSAVFADRPDLFTFNLFSDGGRGISLSRYSPKWQFVRRVCQNALHKYLTTDILQERLLIESERLVDYFKQHEDVAVDPKDIFTSATSSIALTTIFGTNYEYADKELLEAIRHSTDISELLIASNTIDIFPWLRFFPSKTSTRLSECNELFIGFVQQLYESDKKTKQGCVVESISEAVRELKKKDANEESGEGFQLSSEDIIYATRDMFAAGFDSMAITLQWALAYLVIYPTIQRKLHDELDTVLPNDGPVSIKDTEKLPYLRATIYEVLRASSIASLSLPHSTTADTTLAGYTIPKGTMIIPNLWSANRDPSIWKDPDIFKPERFLDEHNHVVDAKQMPSYLPFSSGRRKCLGEELAYLELSTFLANLLKNLRFTQAGSHPPDMTPIFGLGLNIKPYKLKATRRIKRSDVPESLP